MSSRNWENIDTILQHAIKAHDFAVLRQICSSAEEFLEIATYSSHVTKRDSLLAMIVKYGDAPFLNKVLHAYFIDDTDGKERFLQGQTAIGENLNYHYFRDYLPTDVVAKTDAAYGLEGKTQSYSTKEKKRMSDLYRLIKQHRLEIQNIKSKRMFEQMDFARADMSADGKPVLEHKTSDRDNAGVIELELEYPPIALCNIPNLGVLKDRVETVVLRKGKKDESLKTRVYKALDFPEDFVVQARALSEVQKDWKLILENQALRSIGINFMKNGGIIRIDDRDDVRRNSCNYAGYMGKTNVGLPVSAIHGAKFRYGSKTLVHEIAHIADLHKGEMVSDSPFFGCALGLLIVGRNKSNVKKTISHKISTYDAIEYRREFLANIMQSSSGDSDRFLQDLFVLSGKFLDAKIDNHPAVIRRMKTMMKRIRHANDYFILEASVQPYMLAHGKYINKKIGIARLDEEWGKLQEKIAKSRFRPDRYDETEKEFCEDMETELKKINQISADKDAGNINVPKELLGVRSNTATEVLFAEANREYAQNEYFLPREHMDKVAEKFVNLEQNARKYKNQPEELNDRCLLLLAYANKVIGGGFLHGFEAKDFEDPLPKIRLCLEKNSVLAKRTNIIKRMFDQKERDCK